jgi:outer membrane protein
MPRLLALASLLFAGLFSTPAHAQFANSSLGLGVGYMRINDPLVRNAIFLNLESSFYTEDHFDIVGRAPLMILQQEIDGKQVVGAGLSAGFRYLFSEETLRPYAGIDLAYLHIFRESATANYFGVSPNAGLDYFVSDSITLGGRIFANIYLALNAPVVIGPGGVLALSTYF